MNFPCALDVESSYNEIHTTNGQKITILGLTMAILKLEGLQVKGKSFRVVLKFCTECVEVIHSFSSYNLNIFNKEVLHVFQPILIILKC